MSAELYKRATNPIAKQAILDAMPVWKRTAIIEEEQASQSAMDSENTGDYKTPVPLKKKKIVEENDDYDDEYDFDNDDDDYDFYDENVDELADAIAQGVVDYDFDDFDGEDEDMDSFADSIFDNFDVLTPYQVKPECELAEYIDSLSPKFKDSLYLEEGNEYDVAGRMLRMFEEEASIGDKMKEKRRKGRQMKRLKGKMKASRKRKKTRMDMGTIKKRVHKQAIKAVKDKLAKKKGAKSYADLSMSVQVRIDAIAKKKTALIKKMERILLKKFRAKKTASSQAPKDGK